MKKFMYAKLNMLVAVIFVLINCSSLQAQDKSDAIVGIWETEAKDGKMKIFKSGKEYQAKLLWGKDIVKADGTSKKDVNNKDENLQDRDLVGMTYIKGLTFEEDEWDNGKVYNSANGKWYNCYVWLKKDKLHLRGYLGLPIMGETSKWNRVN